MSVTLWANHPDGSSDKMHFSSANAAELFGHLGIDLDAQGWTGQITAGELYQRAQQALQKGVVQLDEGRAPYLRVHPGKPLWVEGRRSPGYLKEKLEEIQCRAVDCPKDWLFYYA